jgi:Ser/Thr protein kinase RdoA (MazF antagonist)
MQENNWIGLRERDNFAYVRGQIPIYSKKCKNSLIISDSNKGEIKGISNHALIFGNGKRYLIPIEEIKDILGIAQNLLGDKRIIYQKPSSILERESLNNLEEDFILQNIFENYEILIDSIKEIQTKKGDHRVYELSSNGEKFMLKYYGKDLNLFNAQANLLKKTSFFPKIISSRKGNISFMVGDSIYYLEEFVDGNSLPQDIDLYYNLVGKHMAFIHNEFNKKSPGINKLEKCLSQEGNHLSESNLISMKIDLGQDFENYFPDEKITSFFEDLNKFRDTLPFQIIHGDLNKSNIIWNENNARVIDFEMINSSKRFNEFIPALLFEGDLSIPKYHSGSLKGILEGYNPHSKIKLTSEEINLLPDFLKISLMKSYVIYVMRRNLNNPDFKNQIKNSLDTLGGETNVH